MTMQNYLTSYDTGDKAEKYTTGLIITMLEKKDFLAWIGNINGQTILDLGCGNGDFTHMLSCKGAQCIGIDISEKFLSLAQQKHKDLTFFKINGTELSKRFQKGTFDKIVMVSVLPNLPDKSTFEAIAQECGKVLKEDGCLLFTAVNPDSIKSYKDALREICLSANDNIKDGDVYKAKYLLSDEKSWITSHNTHWSFNFIVETFSKHNFTLLRQEKHIPQSSELKSQYFSCVKTLPIHTFFHFALKKPVSDQKSETKPISLSFSKTTT